jgi:DNA repair protein RecN (Recombination protein N)
MLIRLYIQNYALIKQLDICFEPSFITITGETGAGKSILLGALNLILGNRADTTVLLNSQQKCIVEATFDLNAYNMQAFFIQHELDFQANTVIRREINAEGKSRAFINDTPVNLQVLRLLTVQLIDIHSQRDSLALNDANYQMNVIDAFAKNQHIVNVYMQLFKTHKEALHKLQMLTEADKTAKSNLDFTQFQYQELSALQLKSDEQENLEHELETLTHADTITQNLIKLNQIIQTEEGTLNQLRQGISLLRQIAKFQTNYQTLADRLESVRIEMQDLSSEVDIELSKVNIEPQRIEFINDRLSSIYRLQKKHSCKTISDLIELQEKFSLEITKTTAMDHLIAEQQALVNSLTKKITDAAAKLSSSRKEILASFESQIKKTLAGLSMPDARLKINLNTSDRFLSNGTDVIDFTFSANKGHDFKSIAKVASGGELSRLMLALKNLIAHVMQLPTLIFDEIDTGVSGQVALQMGDVMQAIATKHQVIAITHLPQIAAKGKQHLNVFKTTSGNTTLSGIKHLNDDERVIEIAKMLGGNNFTTSAETQARELMLNN